MNIILQFCVNTYIMFINSIIIIKNWLFNLPYLEIAFIIVAGYCVYRLLKFEAEGIKEPHIKPSRTRI